MVEEDKKEEKEKTEKKKEEKEKEKETKAPKKKSKMGLFVGGGLLAFLVFLGFFSFSMGVFDNERLKEEMGLVEDTIFHAESPEEDWGDAYLEDEEPTLELDEDSLTQAKEDSANNWIGEQKKDIQEKRTTLEIERRELEFLKIEVDNLLKQKKILESERIAKLAKIYDGMKAQEVVAMMNNLDDETVVAVLLRMKVRNAAKVLGLLNPERAARISRELMVLK